VAVGGLILALGLQFFLPSAATPPEASSVAERKPRPLLIPPPAPYADVLAKPIFAPDRKPGPSDLSAIAGGELAGYSALGAAVGHGAATAVISGPSGSIRTVHVGDIVEGWRVVAVEAAKLTLERSGMRHTLVVGAPAEALSKAAAQGAETEPQ
jgi:general secretion pathway protein N